MGYLSDYLHKVAEERELTDKPRVAINDLDLTSLAPKWSDKAHLLAALRTHLSDTGTALDTPSQDKELADLSLILDAYRKSQLKEQLLSERIAKFKQYALAPSLAETLQDKVAAVTNKSDSDFILAQKAKLPSTPYVPPMAYDRLPQHLKDHPPHAWRGKTGIELIHQEPEIDEFKRIVRNWKKMPDDLKKLSDIASKELYDGKDNLSRVKDILRIYVKRRLSKGRVI